MNYYNLSSDTKGMLFMLCAVILLPFTDAMAKYLSSSLSPIQIVWFRFLLQAIFLYIYGAFYTKQIEKFSYKYAILAFFISASMFFLFWGLKYLPLANNIALFFIEPLILTILSVIFLKEKINKHNIIAIIVGLLGTMIIIRPNWQMFGMASFLPIISAICYAFYLMFIRLLSTHTNPINLHFHTGAISSLFLGIFLFFGTNSNIDILSFHSVDLSFWYIILLLGIVSTSIQLIISKAFSYVKASVLAPFQYLEIIFATILGWMIFDNIPDSLTLFGALVVIFAGLYIAKYQRS